MVRFRALLIATGYLNGNYCNALRADLAFKMAGCRRRVACVRVPGLAVSFLPRRGPLPMPTITDPSSPFRLMLPNGAESPADAARHIVELVAFLAVPFQGDERPALEGEELRGFHILLCTIGSCLSDLERQIRDLTRTNAGTAGNPP
jgi:hypothetical protein